MKSKLILFLIIVQNLTFGYRLMDSWLATPGSHTVYLTHEVDSLATSWGLNFSNCISVVNAHSVTNTPVLIAAGTTSETADCIVKYETVTDFPDAIAVCRRTGPGEYSSFRIIINDAIFNPATHDINSVMMHELTHSLGLDENLTDNTALMYEFYTGITSLTNDEINGIKNVYEKPVIQVLSPFAANGDTLKIYYENEIDDIELRITTPSMLAHNSVVPPDISLSGFFTNLINQYTGKEASFDSLGNSVYNYTTNIKELSDYMESDIFKFRTYNKRNSWTYGDYWSNNSPSGEGLLKITPKPTIESPLPNEIYHVRPGNKGSVTDTLAIKVKVPEILGSYPAINIKIDDVYVNPGDITFDSGENVWIYNWDLSTVSSTEYGRRYSIKAEIDGDPTDYDATGVYLVEGIFHEDFETITDLTAAGWHVYSYEVPNVDYVGWIIGNKVLENNNGVAMSLTYVNSTYVGYRLWTPVISLPSVSDGTFIKLKYRFFFDKADESSLYSLLKFCITNSSEAVISAWSTLPGVDESWVDVEYDLTEYAGQNIKLQWFNNYLTGPELPITEYCVDDVLIYQTIDTSSPVIDFIAGNTAEPNEDMNLTLQFNDASGVNGVSADYSIENDDNTITLYPVKGTYNYTGTIPARDHECAGSITFRIKDSVGNETASAGHSIAWALGGGILAAPENVVIANPTSSTISITWDIVDGATGYKVYSSIDPYGTFTEDSTGTFTESRKWEKAIDGNKYFYYVIATNAGKFDSDAIKEEEFEIAKAVENK